MSLKTSATGSQLIRPGNYRWRIGALLFFATAINYIDRQVLGILAPQLQEQYHWSESQYGLIISTFQIAYAIGFLFMGKFIDYIGVRLGYLISIVFWSAATMMHALFQTPGGFSFARFFLGIGEAGNFPAAVKTVAEWFPPKERSFASGIFVSGSSIGAIIAPLLVPVIAIHLGWQWAFILTGCLGFLWIIFWMLTYHPPANHKKLSAKELSYIQETIPVKADPIPWKKLFRFKETWCFAIAKFFTDPVFAIFFFFLPKFFYSQHGVTLGKIGPPLVVIYLMSDVGSIAGGWFSSYLIKKGWSINSSRKTTMLIAACCVIPVCLATYTSDLWTAVLLIGFALAAHQAWSANLLTLVSDMFPQKAVGSVVGIGSMLGAVGGMFAAGIAGALLQYSGSYLVIFISAACAYLVALLILHLLVPHIRMVGQIIK